MREDTVQMETVHTVKSKFLVFPVNSFLSRKELIFLENGKQIFELCLPLDNIAPTFLANVNTERFIGKEITFKVLPDMDLKFTESDEPMLMPEDASIRPRIHYTARYGWTNDPNGLYKYNGEYHLFYQHNPCDIAWQNMHWGHAKSTDLFHWEEMDEALYPDRHGLIFSGCAYVDKNNASGLKCGADSPILLYYTASPRTGCKTSFSHGEKWTQRIYASVDGGKTFAPRSEYIDEICSGNRDPRIEFSPELEKYVMALYLHGADYAFLTSSDLLHWEELQRVSLAGDDECPNFARFKVEGTDEYKWVLYGAHSCYAVYEIKDGGFVEIQASRAPSYSTAAYAGQDFKDPDTGRRIKIDWLRVTSRFMIPDSNFSQLFGIPAELSLVKDGSDYFLTECPAKEIFALKDTKIEIKNARSGDTVPTDSSAFIVKFNAKYTDGGNILLKIKGRDICIDMKNNVLSCGESSAPLSHGRGSVDITVVADTLSLEIFSDEGKFYTSSILMEDKNINNVAIEGDGVCDASLTLTTLKI